MPVLPIISRDIGDCINNHVFTGQNCQISPRFTSWKKTSPWSRRFAARARKRRLFRKPVAGSFGQRITPERFLHRRNPSFAGKRGPLPCDSEPDDRIPDDSKQGESKQADAAEPYFPQDDEAVAARVSELQKKYLYQFVEPTASIEEKWESFKSYMLLDGRGSAQLAAAEMAAGAKLLAPFLRGVAPEESAAALATWYKQGPAYLKRYMERRAGTPLSAWPTIKPGEGSGMLHYWNELRSALSDKSPYGEEVNPVPFVSWPHYM